MLELKLKHLITILAEFVSNSIPDNATKNLLRNIFELCVLTSERITSSNKVTKYQVSSHRN